MKSHVAHNTHDLRRRMEERAREVPRQLRLENVGIAKDLTAYGKAELQRDVYDKPVKVSSTGRPLWVRTRQLINEEKWVAVGMAIRHRNRAPHYLHRYRYGKPGRRPAIAPQIASYWVRNTVLRNGSKIRARRRAAIRRGWGVPRLRTK